MGKKPFTTRLDEGVLEVAQRLADAERRSVTSLIEVAVLEYEKRGRAAAPPPAGASSLIPALVAHYGQDEEAPDCIAHDVAQGVCSAMSGMDMYGPEYVPDSVAAVFGGRDYIEKAYAYRTARAEWERKRSKNKGPAPEPPTPPG